MNKIKKIKMPNKEIEYLKSDSISELDVSKYLPNVKILLYKDLDEYNTIEELLPNPNTYVFILYVTSETYNMTVGHWMVISRSIQNNIDTIESFESYGYPIEYPLKKWMNETERIRLGENIMHLTNLFNKTNLPVIYNNVTFQNRYNFDIKTCGRYAIYRIVKMLDGMDLKGFYKHMKLLKKQYNVKTFDDLIVQIINI